jgi:hypothetical protein
VDDAGRYHRHPQDVKLSARAVSLLIKALALILLAIAIAYPDLGGLKSKGLGVRAVIYPLGLVALPLLCRLVRCWRPAVRIDWIADALCSLPILVDLAGNRANLFDTIWWWDDAMHVVMHGVLTAAVLRQFWPQVRGLPLITAAVAFGGLSGLAWELGEYLAFMRDGVELSGAYVDTLGDLCGGIAGSLVVGILLSFRWPAPRLGAEDSRGERVYVGARGPAGR